MKIKLTAYLSLSLPFLLLSQANALLESDPAALENSFVKENPRLVFGDGFESGCWRAEIVSLGNAPGACDDDSKGELWHQSQLQNPVSARIVQSPNPVRAGNYSLKLSWRKDKVIIDEEGNYDNTSKKAMLHGPKSDQAKGTERWYGFSVLLPGAGFRVEDHGHLFFQVHGSPDHDLNEPWRQPLFSLSFDHETGGFKGQYAYDAKKRSAGDGTIFENATQFKLKRAKRRTYLDRWVDFVVHLVIDWNGKGMAQVWLDGALVYEAKDIAIGYNDAVGPYPSYGMYYTASEPYNHNHWMFLDEVRIGGSEATYEDVAPYLPNMKKN